MNEHEIKISEKVLNRIESEHTVPHSRPYFVWRNVFIWFFALCTLLLGAGAIASTIFRVVNMSRVLPPHIFVFTFETLRSVLIALPLIWLALCGLFGYVTYYEIRSTKKGYQYELSTLLLLLTVISGVLGFGLYRVGSGYTLDHFASRTLPFHQDLDVLQAEQWLQPENGFLVGLVSDVLDDGFVLEDVEHNVWNVFYADTVSDKDREFVVTNARVGLRGTVIDADENVFSVCSIRPLDIRGRAPFVPHSRIMVTERPERNVMPVRIIECEGVRPHVIESY